MLRGISEMVSARAFKPLPLCSAPLKMFWQGFYRALGMTGIHFLSKNVFLRKCCGESQKWWVLELSNLCHCVQHPCKLTSKDYWSSRKERKPHSQQKCVLRKCYRVSQKLWMLEHFAFVFSTPENLLIGISRPLGMTGIHFSAKMCFEKMLWGFSEMVSARAFKPLPLCSAPLKTYW